jgi:hypothetical protein
MSEAIMNLLERSVEDQRMELQAPPRFVHSADRDGGLS